MPHDRNLPSTDPLHAYAMPARTSDGRAVPVLGTRIRVDVAHGLAVVRTTRSLRNPNTDRSIEVILTVPAPVRATVMALEAKIGDRVLAGVAQDRERARGSYEQGLDEGRTAVLHEEPLRGIHVLSIAHVPPGGDIEVSSTWTLPLGQEGSIAGFRIPVTVGDIYGRSPLTDSDDLLAGGPAQYAELEVAAVDGSIEVLGQTLAEGRTQVLLDAPIDIRVAGWTPQLLRGQAADGRSIWLGVSPAPVAELDLDGVVMVDCSGSMSFRAAGTGTRSKHQVVKAALGQGAAGLRRTDRLGLWEYDNDAEEVGAQSFAAAVLALRKPHGGTQIGRSIETVLAATESRDILLITDGKSHDIDVQRASQSGRRFHVVLIGEDSLEAHVGQLAALTGGQLFVAAGEDAALAILAAFQAMRMPHQVQAPVAEAPEFVEAFIAGMQVRAVWAEAPSERVVGLVFPTLLTGVVSTGLPRPLALKPQDAEAAPVGADFARAVAALATSLALPRLDKKAAGALAEAEGIVCHLTSLVLVDQQGEAQQGLPVQHKLDTMTPRASLGLGVSAAPQAHGASKGIARRLTPAASSGMLSVGGVTRSAASFSLASEQSRGISGLASKRGWDTGFEAVKRALPPVMPTGLGLPSAPQKPVQPVQPVRVDLVQLRGRVDWAAHAETLRLGDFSPLPEPVRTALLALALRPAVRALAQALGLNRLVVALALLAAAEGATQRPAARLARAVLGGADPALRAAAEGEFASSLAA